MEETTVTEEANELNYLELGIPEPEDHEILLTRDQLGRCRRPHIKEAEFRVFTVSHAGVYKTGWWRTAWNGYTPLREESGAQGYNRAIGLPSNEEGIFIYASHPSFPNQKREPVDPSKPKRTCSAERVLGATVCACLKSQPGNESFRAKVMAIVGEMPTKDLDTWEKIKDWVEFNFPKVKPKPENKVIYACGVSKTEYESGHCKFTRRARASSYLNITKEMIDESAANGGTFDEIMEGLNESIEEAANNAVTDTDEEETTNHDVTDWRDTEYDYNHRQLKEAVISYLRSKLTQDEQDDIELP